MFNTRIRYTRPAGRSGALVPTGRSLAGADEVAGLGNVVQAILEERVVRPSFVGRAFVEALGSTRSLWPARQGQTRNVGPWARGVSFMRFRSGQTRQGRGRFGEVEVSNDARNRKGAPYAGYVDTGVRAGPARRQANVKAARRTYERNERSILTRALGLQDGR